MDYSENSNFVLSVGGFHPLFSPPPLPFSNPRRLRIDILNTAVSRISVEAYLAVTSNTAQFGARAELYYGLAVVAVSGHFAFDALFQFSPFKFIIQLSFSVSLKVFGFGLFSIRERFQTLGGRLEIHSEPGRGTRGDPGGRWLGRRGIHAQWGDGGCGGRVRQCPACPCRGDPGGAHAPRGGESASGPHPTHDESPESHGKDPEEHWRVPGRTPAEGLRTIQPGAS